MHGQQHIKRTLAVVARTCLRVTLYVHCLSGLLFSVVLFRGQSIRGAVFTRLSVPSSHGQEQLYFRFHPETIFSVNHFEVLRHLKFGEAALLVL